MLVFRIPSPVFRPGSLVDDLAEIVARDAVARGVFVEEPDEEPRVADLDALTPDEAAPTAPPAFAGVLVRAPGRTSQHTRGRNWTRFEGYLSVHDERGRLLAEYAPGEWRSVSGIVDEAAA